MTFKALNGTGPSYIREMLSFYVPNRSLRSSHENLLVVLRISTKSFGGRAFSFSAPSLWNSLPTQLRFIEEINIFKASIKTFLFKQAFD